MKGILYIVATPIGNLKDITLRALEVLHQADLILAEDTRVTKKLLDRFNIKVNLVSYHQHSGESKKEMILAKLLEGKNLALVTDAGTPGVSDPGNELIDYLLSKEESIKIIPIPGASAITAAISVSSLKMSKFLFLGFLPKKKKNKLFDWLKQGKVSFVFYESPKRLLKSLKLIAEEFGIETKVFVGRELTKIFESTYRGKVDEVIKKLEKEKIKGEIVVLVQGK